MLKRKFSRLAAVVFTAASLFFAGCKSAPVENPVDPVELLDDDGAVYFVVPVQANQDFVNQAVMRLSNCDESDAKKISERTDNIYICVGLNGKVQLSADGNFPSRMISLALTEKKGWSKNQYKDYRYYSSEKSKYQVSLPSSSVAAVSKNVEAMLERFDECANNDLHSVSMREDVYAFFKSENSGDILVYAPAPKTFIKTFIGANVSSPVESISGEFKNLKDGKQFGLKIVLKMNDSRTVKAACAALKIALFPIPAKIVQTGSAEITITDITLGYDSLLRFLK
ncbi:MAG: hypothetical protein SOT81_09615 [Treponema sp.]|nr:hypothetical protein [Treponema sp.]